MISLRIKRCLIVFLTLLIVVSASVTALFLTKNNEISHADTTFAMVDGTSLRFCDEGGIRFRVKMDTNTKNHIVNDDCDLKFIIAPTSLFNKVTDGNYIDMSQKIVVDVDESKIYETDGYWYANGCIQNILEANRNLEFSAIAYYADELQVVYATTAGLTRGNLYNILNQAMFASTDYTEEIFDCSAYNNWYGSETYPISVSSQEAYDKVVHCLNNGELPSTVSINANDTYTPSTETLANDKKIDSTINIASLATVTGTDVGGDYDGLDKLTDSNKSHTALAWDHSIYGSSSAYNITLDFGAVVSWNKILVHGIIDTGSGVYTPAQVAVSYSNDGSSWTKTKKLTLSAINSGDFVTECKYIHTSRYIKLDFTPQGWCIIDEIEVNGAISNLTDNIASKATISSMEKCYDWLSVDTSKLVDGKYGTDVWNELIRNVETDVVFDFGSSTKINYLTIHGITAEGINQPKSIVYSYSNDGESWNTINTITTKVIESSAFLYNVKMPTINARYLKLSIDKNNAFSLDEIEVFGSTYNVKFNNYDGTELASYECIYGETPDYLGATPTKVSDKDGYVCTFAGWDKSISAVTEDTTYTAIFEYYPFSNIAKTATIIGTETSYGWASSFPLTILNDGNKGTNVWSNVFANNVDSYVTFDLGSEKTITAINVHGICEGNGFRIPNPLTVSYSNDGVTWSTATVTGDYLRSDTSEALAIWDCPNIDYNSNFEVTPFTGRYVKFDITKNGGFALDEIEIYSTGYEVKFNNYDGTTLQTLAVAGGEVPVYTGETPTKPSADGFDYIFAGWDVTPVGATKNTVYTATYDTIKRVNVALGKTVTATTSSAYGTNTYSVLVDGTKSTPTNKPYWGSTTQCYANNVESTITIDLGSSYTVSGVYLHGICSTDGVRIPKTTAISYSLDDSSYSDATVTANYYNENGDAKLNSWDTLSTTFYSDITISSFTGRYVKFVFTVSALSLDEIEIYSNEDVDLYTATFKNYDGTILESKEVVSGSTPVYSGVTPTKPSTAQYDYTFSGWSPALSAISNDTEYVAQFNQTVRTYTIRFEAFDGTELETKQVAYGTIPTYTGETPTKEAIQGVEYAFKNWTPKLVAVKGNATYKAQFSVAYTITFNNYDGTLIKSVKVAEGSLPTCDVTPVKANSTNYHANVFTGWSPVLVNATASATYTATFAEYETYRIESYNNISYPSTYGGGVNKGSTAMFTDGIWYAGMYSWSDNTNQLGIMNTGTFVFDFGKVTTWNEIKVHFGIDKTWVFTQPASVTVSYSNDNSSWIEAGTLTVGQYDGVANENWFEKIFNTTSSRYVKLVIVPNSNTADSPRQYFLIDEVEIYQAKNRVQFVNYDGTVLQTSYYKNGETPEYTGVTPEKVQTAEQESAGLYNVFTGWSPAVSAVNCDTTYTAQFISANGYVISFKNYDGSLLQNVVTTEGQTPVYAEATPTRTGDANTMYTFIGWNNALEPAYDNAEYIAEFTETNFTNIAPLATVDADAGESSYTGNDKLTDGTTYSTFQWNNSQYGRLGKVFNVYFNFGSEKTWYKVRVHGVDDDSTNQPHYINVYSSDNNSDWTLVGALTTSMVGSTDYWSENIFSDGVSSQYVKVEISANSWSIIDEIEIYSQAYKITFNNPDEELIQTVYTSVGELPVAPTASLTNTTSSINVFTGWDTAITTATENKTYTAQYRQLLSSNVSIISDINDSTNYGKLIDDSTSSNWGDGSWVGSTSNLSLTFDLGTERYWGFFRVHYRLETSSGIVLPTFTVSSSNDNSSWSSVGSFSDDDGVNNNYNWAEGSLPTVYSRYVKIDITKSGYMFYIDEIEIYGYRESYGTNIASLATVTAPDGVINDYYSLNGKTNFTDNKYLDSVKYGFGNEQWGYNGTAEIVFDFYEATRYNIIRVHGGIDYASGVRVPGSINAYKSTNGSDWTLIKSLNIKAMGGDSAETCEYYWAQAEFDFEETRYIKIEFTSTSVLSIIDEIQIFGESEELPDSDIDRSYERVEISACCDYTLSTSTYSGFEDTDDGILTGIGDSELDYVGFSANQQVSIVVDLGSTYDIAAFSLIAKKNTSIGAVLPEYITFYTSLDGSSWSVAGKVYASTVNTEFNDYNLELYFKVSGRYVKFETSATAGTMYLIERTSVYSYIQDYQGIYPTLNLPTVTTDETWNSTSTSSVNFVSGKTPWITVPGGVKVYPDGKNFPASKTVMTDGTTVSSWSGSKSDIYNGKYFIINGWNSRNIYFDFGYLSSIKTVKVGVLSATGSGVYAPNIRVSLSVDGKTWYNVGTLDYSSASNNTVTRNTLTLSQYTQARFICFSFDVDQWVGIDEIQVYGTKKLQGSKVDALSYTIVSPEYNGNYSTVTSNALSGANDIYLAYHGYNSNVSVDSISKAIAYYDVNAGKTALEMKDTMFDSVLFLAGSTGFPSGNNSVGGLMSLTKADYEWLSDTLVNTSSANVQALNSAVATMKTTLGLASDYKVKFFVSLYYPGATDTWTLDGNYSSADLSTASGKATLLKWWIEDFETNFASANLTNVEFCGYYWYHEVMSDSTEIAVATDVASFIHNRFQKIFWIPYFGANGIADADDIGFDLVSIQNNASFYKNKPINQIGSITNMIKAYGDTMEIEMDYRVLTDNRFIERYFEYLEQAMISGQMTNAVNIYYIGTNDFARLLNDGGWQNGYVGKLIYDITYKYVKGTLTNADLKPNAISINSQVCSVDSDTTFTFINSSNHIYQLKLYESPIHGSVTINDDYTITYHADSDYTGSITFTVVYSQYLTYSEPITVTVVVS